MIKQFSENAPVGVLKPCCTISADRIRALTASRPIKPTSTRCPSAWQPNPGRGSTYRRGKAVQTTGTTSEPVFGASRPSRTAQEAGATPIAEPGECSHTTIVSLRVLLKADLSLNRDLAAPCRHFLFAANLGARPSGYSPPRCGPNITDKNHLRKLNEVPVGTVPALFFITT
jgi:hypothetical protein